MLFEVVEESKVFIQCFDSLWMKNVDVKMAVINYNLGVLSNYALWGRDSGSFLWKNIGPG